MHPNSHANIIHIVGFSSTQYPIVKKRQQHKEVKVGKGQQGAFLEGRNWDKAYQVILNQHQVEDYSILTLILRDLFMFGRKITTTPWF